MAAASSGERAHSMVGWLAPTSPATAVPHEPAPITATRSLMGISLRPRERPLPARTLSGVPAGLSAHARARRTAALPNLGTHVVLIPVKAFEQAKRRLGLT